MTDYRNALPLGTVLDHGKYVLDAVLGEGGFGVVYRARHGKVKTLYVAIKEYLPAEIAVREGGTVYPRSAQRAADYEEGLNRFIEEAHNLVALEGHPNIVRCADFFQENGTAYLVMAYEGGASLDKVLRMREERGEPLEESEARAILLPLLDGLAYVHAKNMLHRDIKPGNVFIRRRDEQPVLLDFGAAKQEFSHYSKSRAQAYTEGYAPVEQVEHEGALGPWTDLYAIGALMWRIATGTNPVDVMSGRVLAQALGRPDPMRVVANTGDGRFSERYLGVMRQCLEMDQAQRPQSVAQVLALLDGKVIPPDPPIKEQPGDTPVPPVKQPVMPPPLPAEKKPRWAIALVVLALVVGGGCYALQLDKNSKQETEETTLPPPPSAPASKPDANGFVDRGNGVLFDTQTGLEWTKKDNGRDINWHDAKKYCDDLRTTGGR